MKTLVAIDGSDCSMKALSFIAERPWNSDDQFMVLSVVEPIPQTYGVGYVPPVSTGKVEDRMFEECVKITAKGGAAIQSCLPNNPVQVKVESGLIVETICRSAESWGADLIVLGSHGRKGLAHFFLGSVAEEVLKQAPCSVEVIK